MSNTKVYREIVQAGLDCRAAERRDAELEKQASKLRLIINDNHTAKTSGKAPERRQEKPGKDASAIRRRKEERAERAAEASYCNGWYSFILRIFAPLVIGAATLGLCNTGVLPFALAIPCAIVACLISVEIFASHFLHERRG